MKKLPVVIVIGILLLGIVTAANAQTMDAPHNSATNQDCNSCHALFTIGAWTDTVCLSCHNNDTGGGYTKNSAPKVLTHSSDTTSAKYAPWQTSCIDCHWRQVSGTHGQLQRITNGAATYLVTGTITSVTSNPDGSYTYGYGSLLVNNTDWADYAKWGTKSSNATGGNERGLVFYKTPVAATPVASEVITATSNTITVTGNPGAIAVGNTFALIYGQFIRTSINNKAVKFYTNAGLNSFAHDESNTGTDPTPNGVCQVCHTQTSVFRSNGTLAGTGTHDGRNGVNCIVCHKHESGFAADCTSCHGQPPVDSGTMVSSPAPTGSTTAGKHNTHINILGLACGNCHYNSVGTGATHNDGTVQAITMGFYISSTFQGGAYDGQTTADYNVTTTTPSTSVTNSGTLQCSNIYCHSTGQGTNGGALTAGDYKTPTWTGSVVCGDCHKSTMDSGSHTVHITAPLSKTCAECHKNAGAGTALHANAVIEVSFNVDPFSNSAAYSQSPNTPGNGYGTCSTVYCHSIGQRNGGNSLVSGTSDYKSPAWGGTAVCGSCHEAIMTSGSHTPHLNVAGYNCATCHTNAGSGTALHADGSIDTAFNAALAGNAGSYSQAGTPGNGYGTCSTVYCHGTISPQWGADFTGVATCEKCHGSAATAALGSFKDTSGSTASGKAITHVAHLAGTHNLMSPIVCSTCHAVPATVTTAGHIDSALPAEVNPALGFGGTSCATSYCHGNAMPKGTIEGANRTPSWSDTGYLNGNPSHDCAQCHGYPPASIAAHASMGPTTCINCHDHVNASGTGFTDLVPGPSKHINGVLDGGGDNCFDCHSSLSATHAKHVDAATVLAGKKLSLGHYGQASWFYGVSYSSGSPKFACGYCHPNTTGTHMNGVKNLNFDANEAGLPAGTVKGKNGYPSFIQSSGTSVTCSSVYCHSTGYNDGTGYIYQTTPDWYGGVFSADKCANCHGNSPNSGGKPGSLSHYNTNAMGMGVVGGHFVGIHYKNVFTGTTGLTKDGSNRPNAHGTATTSTTINCQTCHSSTVSMTGNDQNNVCASCHTSPSKGTMSIDALSTTHINGTPDVAFALGTINSKAQVRDDITTVTELNSSWTRNNGYKGGATSSDGSKTIASYDSGTKSCSSVACHNGNSVKWAATNITCNSCHTSLP